MSTTTFAPTDEQIAALDIFTTGQNMVITAGAGAGKTSTLRLLADSVPQRRGLYLAFNKSVQMEAARTFGDNVEARTANSLAFQGVPEAIRTRIETDRQTYTEQAALVGVERRPKVLGMFVPQRELMMAANAAVAAFCRTADTEIGADHVTIPRGLKAFNNDTFRGPFEQEVVRIANRIWDDARSERGELRLTHDHLLKMWGLTNPTLDYDFILFDEGQDSEPVILGVVQGQSAQIVAVGDSAQAIYSWRGSIDSLEKFDGQRTSLTQSWRFGQDIADEANVWLSALGMDMRITGNPNRESTVGRCLSRIPDVVLCRTNGGIISQVIRAQQRGIPVALAGKDTGRKVRDLAVAAGKLQHGQWQSHPDLLGFRNWSEVQAYVEEDPAGADIAVLVRLVDAHGADELVRAVDNCVPVNKARVATSTAHTAKGLEWDHVRIDEDFPTPRVNSRTGVVEYPEREDLMLAYVSVTRAKTHLDPRGLEWVHSMPGVQPGPPHRDETRNAAHGAGSSRTQMVGGVAR